MEKDMNDGLKDVLLAVVALTVPIVTMVLAYLRTRDKTMLDVNTIKMSVVEEQLEFHREELVRVKTAEKKCLDENKKLSDRIDVLSDDLHESKAARQAAEAEAVVRIEQAAKKAADELVQVAEQVASNSGNGGKATG